MNWKIEQIIIWKLQLRHLNLKKNNISFWFKNNRDFWKKMFIWTTEKTSFQKYWELFHWKFWSFFSLDIKEYVSTGQALEIHWYFLSWTFGCRSSSKKGPLTRPDSLSCKSKLLKIPELAAPCVSSSSVAQELNKTWISHCKVTKIIAALSPVPAFASSLFWHNLLLKSLQMKLLFFWMQY